MYMLDPDNGRRRRHIARDKALKHLRRGSREATRRLRYREGVARGIAHHLASAPDATLDRPDDVTLARKVESAIYRDRSIPKGQLNVNAERGIVYLRGQLSTVEQIDRVLDHARTVMGVQAVRSLLHTAETEPPTRNQAPSGRTA
jgi:osmotically-inducible protein OsmY